jgi:hypothetical protein
MAIPKAKNNGKGLSINMLIKQKSRKRALLLLKAVSKNADEINPKFQLDKTNWILLSIT